MIRCQACNRITRPNERTFKVTTQTRKQKYEYYRNENDDRPFKTTYGTEIVKQITVGTCCIRKYPNQEQ